MIDYESMFRITYGLYIVSSGNDQEGNGFISNTVFQVTSTPPRFASCCNKDNHTAGIIQRTGHFSVSVLHSETSPEIFGTFGYRSGKDLNKMEGMEVRYGESGVPIIVNDAIAFLECRVVDTYDVGTHLIFIGELTHAEILDEHKTPMTYQYYREVKKGVAPKNAPTYVDKSKLVKKDSKEAPAVHECAACGYLYNESEEETPFANLPDDYICPICGAEKNDFFKH